MSSNTMLNLKTDLLNPSKHSSADFAPVENRPIINKEHNIDVNFFEYILISYIYNYTVYAIENLTIKIDNIT